MMKKYAEEDFSLLKGLMEIVQLSPFNSADTYHLISLLREYFIDSTLLVTDSDSEMREFVYGTDVGVDRQHVIVALSFISEPYLLFIGANEYVTLASVQREFIAYMKKRLVQQAEIEKRKVYGHEIAETVNLVVQIFNNMRELLNSSVRSKRKGYNTAVHDDVELPSKEVLQKFYECGRKSVLSEQDRQRFVLEGEETVYLCSRCGGYHRGHTPTGQKIPEEIMYGRWRTAWRRYYNL